MVAFERRETDPQRFAYLLKVGRAIMGCVYFSLPLIAGYYLYSWTEKRAAINGMRGAHPEALRGRSRTADQLIASNRELNELFRTEATAKMKSLPIFRFISFFTGF